MVPQAGLDLGMTGHAIGLDRLQPHDRAGVAQRAVMRIGIGQERLVERIEIEARRAPSGGAAAKRVGEPVGDIVAAERHVVGADMLDPAFARR